MVSPFLCRDFNVVHSSLERSGPIMVSPSTIAFSGTMIPFAWYQFNPVRKFYQALKKIYSWKNPISHRPQPFSITLKNSLFPIRKPPNPAPLQAPFPKSTQIQPELSPGWDPRTPCSIENSWKNCMKRGPGRMREIHVG